MKNKNGITLIALIITIIVMLILIAVTVALVINSGLIDTAKRTSTSYKTAKENEENMGTEVTIGDQTYSSPQDYVNSLYEVKTVLSLVEGDIVRYNSSIGNIDCIVLYDSNEENFENLGVQIVSLDTVGSMIEIGNGTNVVNRNDDATLFALADETYVGGLDMLNERAESYIKYGLNDVARDARCIGSKPTDKSSKDSVRHTQSDVFARAYT